MDARMKFRHLRPANLKEVEAVKAQVTKDMSEIDQRLKSLARSRQCTKDSQMLRTHFVIWLDACRKQQAIEQSLVDELNTSVYKNDDLNLLKWDENNVSLSQLHEAQSKDLEVFVSEVIKPLSQLRLDIKQSRRSNQTLRAELRDANSAIEVETFKLVQLEIEFNAFPLASRLDTFRRLSLEDAAENHGGIPSEAWEWPTHDEVFRDNLLSEFIHLDTGFLGKIKGVKKEFTEMEREYRTFLFPSSLDKWKDEEVYLAEFLWEVYNSSEVPRRRETCIDLLSRIPTIKSKKPFSQLMDFIRVHDVQKMKLEDLVQAWTRARQDLADRIQLTLEDAIESNIRKKEEQASVEKQRMICQQLAEQVQQWRKQKAELEELEFRAKEAERKVKMAQEKERQDRETHRRQIIKNKLRHRKESQLREQAEFEEAERLRMEELRRVFEKQRRKDTKRLVEMAKARLKRQSELRVEALGELARQKEEAEARLEAIRAKVSGLPEKFHVRPVVPDDPFRVYSSTESWRHRLEQTTLPEEQEVVEARELLKFYVTIDNPITTFTDAQIQKDRRNRISTALFEAGLLGSNYARNLLAQVPPSKQQAPLLRVSEAEAPARRAKKCSVFSPKTDLFRSTYNQLG
ncbi:unnamed protein product [Mesocestoides corti]|uniref:Coiled-coil domain-containing protein 148 n=2 Tax=Mesocestoides corti TaxID=53468 RepID=A0A0R3UI33_MESCO|nr:unnamed protein product [Mesocestoides corti]